MSTGQGRRVAIVGGGAIGGYLAGEFERAGHAVTLCVRTPVERLVVVEADEGTEREVAVRIVARPDEVGPVDWLVVTTKAQDVAGAAPWIGALAGPETVTAVVQNGVEQDERVRPYLPDGAGAIPATIYCAVERTAPGRVVHHEGARIAMPDDADGRGFAALFAGTRFAVTLEADFRTAAWRKLLSNVSGNLMTALALRRMDMFRDPQALALARDVMLEALAVARAVGARLDESDVERHLANFAKGGDRGSSMLYDRLAGRALEYAHLSGAVVEAGDAHSVATPLNRTLMVLAAAASAGRLDGSV